MILETLSLTVRPQSSGEPDAGKPPVRFGGRGDFNTVVPTPILHTVPTGHRPYRCAKRCGLGLCVRFYSRPFAVPFRGYWFLSYRSQFRRLMSMAYGTNRWVAGRTICRSIYGRHRCSLDLPFPRITGTGCRLPFFDGSYILGWSFILCRCLGPSIVYHTFCAGRFAGLYPSPILRSGNQRDRRMADLSPRV